MDQSRLLDVLCRTCGRISGAWSLEEGCSAVVHAAREMTGCRSTALLLLTDGNLKLHVITHRGLSDHFAYHYRPDLDANATLSRVVRGGETVHVADAAVDAEAASDLTLEHPPGSALAVPVRGGSVGLGCLVAEAADPGALADEHVTLCCLLGHLVAGCYDRHTLRQQQRHATLTDPDTGVYSFDFFASRLREEMTRAGRYERSLGVLVLELDHLDRYRQVHGQREASLAVARVVHVVSSHLRPVDTVGRYHQWQLAVSMPEADAAGLAAAGKRLVASVAEAAFGHAEPALTLSVGGAVAAEGDTVSALVERAQRALYRAQMDGGNRTHIEAEA